MSIGGSKSGSSSRSSFDQNVWGPQTPYLGNLFASAQNLWGNQMGGFPIQYMNQGLQNLAPDLTNLWGGGQVPAYQQQLEGGASAPLSNAITGDLSKSLSSSLLSPTATSQVYNDIMQGSNSYVDPAIGRLGGDISELVNSHLIPQSTSKVSMSPSHLGGSRQGVIESNIYKDALDSFADTASAMRLNAHNDDLLWKTSIASQADMNRGAAQDRALGLLGQQDMATTGALNFAPNMQALGVGTVSPYMQMMQTPWNMMMNYANILGNPLTLTSGTSKGKSSSGGFGISL